MKYFATILLLLASTAALKAQKITNKTNAAKPAVCRNLKDSASYAIGYNIGQNLANRYGDMDPNMIILAIKDAYAKKNSVIDVNAGQIAVQNFQQSVEKKKADLNKAAGKKFLDENKSKPGVIMTASGLQYQVITMGTGPKPTSTNSVKVNYAGTLINGKEFDNSAKHGGPAVFKVSGVISGWTEALQLMPVGSKFKLFIPSNLAYGDSAMGSDIPAGSTLIFEVELVEIVK
ncbi:MAG: FKBP-type peptidyl-prolyl cis-trans isomerase [Chitinophagaceae bacterium]|nr:FKBP-type peptidyl-prolyl cis-trans isomerase [Chitinophagaceae bacterium]